MRQYKNYYTFFYSLFILISFNCSAFSAPEAMLDKDTIDLGSLYVHEERTEEITMQNTGDQELIIEKIIEECECASIQAPDMKIAPGGSTKFKIKFLATEENGEIIEQITLNTNDPNNQEINLHIRAIVMSFSSNTPEKLDFGSCKPGEKKSVTLDIIPAQTIPELDYSDYKFNTKFFEISSKTKSKDGDRRIQIKVDYNGQAPAGKINDNLRLNFKTPISTYLEIPVSVSIAGKVEVIPDKIFYGRFAKKDKVKRVFKIENKSEEEMKITAVKSIIPASAKFEHSIAEVVKGKVFEITTFLESDPAALPAGLQTGKITVETGMKSQPSIDVLISFTVAK